MSVFESVRALQCSVCLARSSCFVASHKACKSSYACILVCNGVCKFEWGNLPGMSQSRHQERHPFLERNRTVG